MRCRPPALLCLLSILLIGSTATAQPPVPPPPLPGQGPAPLLYVSFTEPAGMEVTFYQGDAVGFKEKTPVTVGLRPGYIYRVMLTDLPGLPGVSFYPTLEVRGSLLMPPKSSSANHPVPIGFSARDIEQVGDGALITKVFVLENPERATPVATAPRQPLEFEPLPGEDPVTRAREIGRPLVIVRLGSRDVGARDLVRQNVPGTILLPGMKWLPPAAFPAWTPWEKIPVYDPFLGPKPPEEECLKDGGDVGPPAGLDVTGRIVGGLDPSDTVAVYTDNQNRRHIAPSNRVCICVPRFAVVRETTGLTNYLSLLGPNEAGAVQPQSTTKGRLPSYLAKQSEQPAGMQARQRPNATIGAQGLNVSLQLEVLRAVEIPIGLGVVLGTNKAIMLTSQQKALLLRQVELAWQLSQPYGLKVVDSAPVGTQVVGRVEGTNVIGSMQTTRDVTVCCNEPPAPPSKPLVLFKWADRQSAQVGDVVTLFLKYSNLGGQPFTDVSVSDSLTGRLEYVPGSAKTNREAVLTMQPNEAGSLILRWEVAGKLLPGESGIVSFQARVR